MTSSDNLNPNELKVLKSLIQQVKHCTGDEFGYMEDVERGEFSKHEFAGYISSLKAKNIFKYIDHDLSGQFAINDEYFEI